MISEPGVGSAMTNPPGEQVWVMRTALQGCSPEGNGKDLDYFFRVIVHGGALTCEPSCFVWHRDTCDAFDAQAVGYGRGMTAWAMKLMVSPIGIVAACPA